MARASVTQAFLIHARPYRETDTLCELFTEQHGRMRCRLASKVPEPYRQFEIKLADKGRFPSASGFRYTQPVLIDNHYARILSFYVNELLYRLLPLAQSDRQLFGRYISTLVYLNQHQTILAALRFWEQGLLSSVGQSIDYRLDAYSVPIELGQRYRFELERGFIVDASGRYLGALLLALGRQDYSVPGALGIARECQRMQIDSLLSGQMIYSRDWPLACLGAPGGLLS